MHETLSTSAFKAAGQNGASTDRRRSAEEVSRTDEVAQSRRHGGPGGDGDGYIRVLG